MGRRFPACQQSTGVVKRPFALIVFSDSIGRRDPACAAVAPALATCYLEALADHRPPGDAPRVNPPSRDQCNASPRPCRSLTPGGPIQSGYQNSQDGVPNACFRTRDDGQKLLTSQFREDLDEIPERS